LWIPGRKPLVDVKSLPDRVSTGRGKEGKPHEYSRSAVNSSLLLMPQAYSRARQAMRAGVAKRYSSTFRRYRTLPEGTIAAQDGQYTGVGPASRPRARPARWARAGFSLAA